MLGWVCQLLIQLGSDFNIQLGDTVLSKFSFISDSIPNSLDGLMFDSLYLEDYAEHVNHLQNNQTGAVNLYPNPAIQNITIEITDAEFRPFILLFPIVLGDSFIKNKLYQ